MLASTGKTASESARRSPGKTALPWHSVPTAAARRFHQICFAKTLEVVGSFGLTPLQYGAMVYLNKQNGNPGVEQNILGDRLNIDRNTTSVVVEQMVKLGLVLRRVNSADRRSRLLSLTAKGEKTFAALLPEFTALNASILAPLSPSERAQFMDLLVRMIEANLPHENSAGKSPPRSKR